jgi:hypothetical protein
MSAQEAQVVEPQEFIDVLDYDFLGNDVTVFNKRAFIAALVETHTVYVAAHRAGVNKVTAYRWYESDPDFAKAWEEALEDSTDELESCLYERAKEKDTLAAIFLLKGYRPKFRDRVTIDLQAVQDEIQSRIGNNAAALLPAVTTTSSDDPSS